MSFGDTGETNPNVNNVKVFHPPLDMQIRHLNVMAYDINTSPKANDGLNQENKNTPTVTIATPFRDQIPAAPAAQYTFQNHIEIEASSAPLPITPENPRTEDNFNTTPTKATRQSMRILELAQRSQKDKANINSMAHGWGPTDDPAVTKEAPVTLPAHGISVRSAGKVRSQILDPRGGAGVTKNTVNRRLMAQNAAKAKCKDEVEKEVKNLRANHVNRTKKNNHNITTADNVHTMTRKVTPGELLNGTERHMRILRWVEQCAQAQPFLQPTAPKTPPHTHTILTNTTAATSAVPNSANASTKPAAPVLKLKAGAGITKQIPEGRGRGQIGLKSEASPKGKVEVGEGHCATAGVTKNAKSSNLPNNQTLSQTIVKMVSPILKPKDGAGVTKKTVKPGLHGQNTENTAVAPKLGTTKPKARGRGKKKSAAEKIREETAVLMLNLEWLKSVDAELGRLVAECRDMMKSEDTATVGSFNNILRQSTTQGAGTGASPSQGLSSAESMDTLTKFMDTIEQWGMEGGIRQANNQGQVTISDAESP